MFSICHSHVADTIELRREARETDGNLRQFAASMGYETPARQPATPLHQYLKDTNQWHLHSMVFHLSLLRMKRKSLMMLVVTLVTLLLMLLVTLTLPSLHLLHIRVFLPQHILQQISS